MGDKVNVVDDLNTFKLMQKNIDNYHPSQNVVSFHNFFTSAIMDNNYRILSN